MTQARTLFIRASYARKKEIKEALEIAEIEKQEEVARGLEEEADFEILHEAMEHLTPYLPSGVDFDQGLEFCKAIVRYVKDRR